MPGMSSRSSLLRTDVLAFVTVALLSVVLQTVRGSTVTEQKKTVPQTPTKPTDDEIIDAASYRESRLYARNAALKLGVKPPSDTIPRWVLRLAWKAERIALSFISLFDHTPDSKLSLRVLWWKALSGNDVDSPVFDDGLTYDMLPGGFRWLVSRRLQRFHFGGFRTIIEIRTAYLDAAVSSIAGKIRGQDPLAKIRLVSMGAGYDVRSMKLRERGIIDKAYELDLPRVIEAKTRILHSKQFQRRRPLIVNNDMLPEFHAVDLNNLDQVKTILSDIVRENDKFSSWHTIFLFEGVLIYLNNKVPGALLEACREAVVLAGQGGSLCFADGLENVQSYEAEDGRLELARHGWRLVDWLPKGGKAKFMGYAEVL